MTHTALIAGASEGIGASIATYLAAQGFAVGLMARRPAQLDQVVRRIGATGGTALALPCDLRHPPSMDAALDELRAELGPPTIVVWAAAGRFTHTKLHLVPDADLGELIDLDLVAAMRLLRRLLPAMMSARHGRIVLLGSLAASMGIRGGTAYGTAKAGLEGLARGVALDYGRFGITANVLRLGMVDTERLVARAGEDGRRDLARRNPTRQLVQPAEVARNVAWLVDAPSTTGSVIEISGGAHLSPR